MIVVATDEEYALARKRWKHAHIVKTGVGGVNVVRTLRKYPRFIKITNFGYCGSNILPIGTECEVRSVRLYHPSVRYDERAYILDGKVDCFTSADFVTETKETKPCIFDMELAFILALGFKKVKSIKVVSDNLNISEYERAIR